MTCELFELRPVQKFVSEFLKATSDIYELQCRYEAGLLFAYLAFVPFCEAGVMDGLSLQVSCAAKLTLFSLADDFFCGSFIIIRQYLN
jgi:hypothetical protein